MAAVKGSSKNAHEDSKKAVVKKVNKNTQPKIKKQKISYTIISQIPTKIQKL